MIDTTLPNPRTASVRMLYVEDDHIGAGLVKRNLERSSDFRVDLAGNGREGFDLARSNVYDILLVDHDMPEMGGLELVRQLRLEGNRVPAIMITGAGDERTAISALKSGCRDYIIKDVDGSYLQLLPAVVDQVLKQEAAERMLAEKQSENHRLLADLLETNKRLKRLNELKNEVLGIAAHDIRSPMSAIVNAVEYLIEEEPDRDSRRYALLEVCRRSSRQVLHMIDELLNPARIEEGGLSVRLQPMDLGELVREVIELNHASAERKGVSIHREHVGPVPGMVDPFRFRELADNLVSNAIKYTRPGSRVRVSVFQDGAHACFSVKDEGPGFTDEDRLHLYTRFRRLSARPTGNESSTGLGLSIVKKIADLHGATIELKTAPGEGAEFTVRFATS